jgi:hypothetical protein
MWARWAIATIVAVAALAALVIAIHRAGPEGTSEAGAEAEVNRLADITIAEDQAPRSASLLSGSAPVSALEQAIERDVRKRIATDNLAGPLQRVFCKAAGATEHGRTPYHCTVRSSDVAYPFLAIVDSRQRTLIWCKVDQAPAPGAGQEVPVSASCKD